MAKTSSAVQLYIAAAAKYVSAAAASVKASRMELATKYFPRSSFTCSVRQCQGAHISACQLPLGAWLQMLCTLLWVMVVSRHPQASHSLHGVIACVSFNMCIAVMAGMSLAKLQSGATAAWSLITSTSATAAAWLKHYFTTVSTFVRSLTSSSSVALTSCLSAARQRTPSFYCPTSSICLLRLFDILHYGVYVVSGLCLSLVFAVSLVLPSLAFDWLLAGLMNSWPTGLVLLS